MNLITSQELEKELKVTRQAIYNWRKQGMPYIKVGRLVRYNLKDVIDWLQQK